MMVSAAAAQDAKLPRLETNEAYIADVTTGNQKLAIDDPLAVFAYVLGSLPERVKVYPTENHYYFRSTSTAHAMPEISRSMQTCARRQSGILLLRRPRNLAEDSEATAYDTRRPATSVTVEKIDRSPTG